MDLRAQSDTLPAGPACHRQAPPNCPPVGQRGYGIDSLHVSAVETLARIPSSTLNMKLIARCRTSDVVWTSPLACPAPPSTRTPGDGAAFQVAYVQGQGPELRQRACHRARPKSEVVVRPDIEQFGPVRVHVDVADYSDGCPIRPRVRGAEDRTVLAKLVLKRKSQTADVIDKAVGGTSEATDVYVSGRPLRAPRRSSQPPDSHRSIPS